MLFPRALLRTASFCLCFVFFVFFIFYILPSAFLESDQVRNFTVTELREALSTFSEDGYGLERSQSAPDALAETTQTTPATPTTEVVVIGTLQYLTSNTTSTDTMASNTWSHGVLDLVAPTHTSDTLATITRTAPATPPEKVIVTSKLQTGASNTSSDHAYTTTPVIPGDRVIVMGKLQHEDTSWVQQHLADWQSAIYVVDNTNSPGLHTLQNKGHEANAYLLYIIQNYNNLPSTIVFLHPHRDGYPTAWHNDHFDYDNLVSMKMLNLELVQKKGYVNLRCKWFPGCPDEVQYLRNSEDPGHIDRYMPDVWHYFFGQDSAVPEIIATPCCAQFAVSRDQVLTRPLEDYKRYHQWLMDTTLSDDTSGRILEYLWHVIFGKDAVYCPDEIACYWDVYARYVARDP